MTKITKSSTAEYFAKNLQQVGFSSPTKAVLTTLKEAVDNSLDACESAEMLPELSVEIERVGKGGSRNTDLVAVRVTDNGPGIEVSDLPAVFGEYLASSKFGRGRCTRGQQGIGISAATTWAQLTNAKGVSVISKTTQMRKAVKGLIDVDIKNNKGVFRDKVSFDWDRPHGVFVEFIIDGRIQLNGEGGLLTYLDGTTLVNPHLTLHYKILEGDWIHVERVSQEVPKVPASTLPHPHTMKMGEFITHSKLYGKVTLANFLTSGFSRITPTTLQDFAAHGLKKQLLKLSLSQIAENDFKDIFQAIQDTELVAPSTRSVLTVGEEALSKSIFRLGEVDFFSVVTRKPRICDFKPVVVEVAIARFLNRGSEEDESVRLLRFANRVPLQFDKSACAITRAIESVNWRTYGLNQPRGSLPLGPYVFAVSVVSPFIKFKNASKETIDASDELVEELRRTLMQAGQKLSRHIRKEHREADLERKIQHIEQFGPILVEGLARLVEAPASRKLKAAEGLRKILGRESEEAESALEEAQEKLKELTAKTKIADDDHPDEATECLEPISDSEHLSDTELEEPKVRTTKKSTKKELPSKPKNTTHKRTTKRSN